MKDECDNEWEYVGSLPRLVSDNAKFGKALIVDETSHIKLEKPIYLGGQDFTVDVWWLPQNLSNLTCFMFNSYNGPQQFGLYHFSGPPANNDIAHRYKIRTHYYHSNGALLYALDVNYNPLGTNNHIAYVYRHSERCLRIFVNGVCYCILYVEMPRYEYNLLCLGEITGSGTNQYDEFRVSDGIARWIENFTPPTKPFEID